MTDLSITALPTTLDSVPPVVNDQWRVCFRWTAAGPEDVEIVDYH